MIIIAVPATVRSLERREGDMGVIIPAEGEGLLGPPRPPQGKAGRCPKREEEEEQQQQQEAEGAEGVGTRPQVGGGVHGPIEMGTGVTPPLPRRNRQRLRLRQHLPGVTIGNSSSKTQPVQVLGRDTFSGVI